MIAQTHKQSLELQVLMKRKVDGCSIRTRAFQSQADRAYYHLISAQFGPQVYSDSDEEVSEVD